RRNTPMTKVPCEGRQMSGEARLRALREALKAGERSGASTPFDCDAFLARKRVLNPQGR
ncbi:type II toxin-antitoxin system ParD family antitoxin, partial [Mycobacterium avium]|uniref:type II toxin-antitoxin system ParD family antitoxin n=1 Tax=Mycobacterium avium TaxID=1764 RepID=UPI001593D411